MHLGQNNSFEFLKYHTFNNYNYQSTEAIFYGADTLYNKYNFSHIYYRITIQIKILIIMRKIIFQKI